MAKEKKIFYPSSRSKWRAWLKSNHNKEQNVWLVLHRKESKTPSVKYAEAVEEALCFGWIDSVANKRDDDSFILYFAVRKKGGVWSKINKGRIERMIKERKMTPAGMKRIEEAKKDGSWDKLNSIDELQMPLPLKKAFATNKKALKNFHAFPDGVKKQLYFWVLSAKTEVTRGARVKEIVSKASRNIRANQWVPKGKR